MVGKNLLTRASLVLCLLLGFAARQLLAAGLPGSLPEGYWQDAADPDFLIGFEDSRLLIGYGGRVREVVGSLSPSEEGAVGCEAGRESHVSFTREGPLLLFLDAKSGKHRRLRRLPCRPDSFLFALTLPEPFPIAEARVLAIQKEIWERDRAEQAALRPAQPLSWLPGALPAPAPNPPGALDFRMIEQATENAELIETLVKEVGWIDVRRFGYPASKAAFFLVQHTWDPVLLQAVLPFVKRDVDAGLIEGSTYALLFDRASLAAGLRQRYGTQVVSDDRGNVLVLPVEAREGIDDRRQALGMGPLADYVAVLGAAGVAFSEECGSASSLPPPQR